jgi:hypothetical protein
VAAIQQLFIALGKFAHRSVAVLISIFLAEIPETFSIIGTLGHHVVACVHHEKLVFVPSFKP